MEEIMIEMKEPKIERRDFLKLSGSTAALAVFGNKLLGKPKESLVETAKTGKAAPKEGWYPGLCKMCMQGDCVTRVKVVDGVVVKVEGDPRAPNNEGRLCPRGNAAIATTYNPWRVKAPLKRTNPKKGLDEDPGFVEITWEEALQTVGDRLKQIKDDDPRKFVLVTGFGQIAAGIAAMGPFMASYGSPNDVPSRGQACAYHAIGGLVHNASPDSVVDMDLCEYVINIGRSMGPNYAIASSGSKVYVDAIERGCEVITVDPRCSPEASKATQWVPIRPATDFAFLLGMLYSTMYEIGLEKLDVWAIKNRTNGPYLIAPDGEYVVDPDTEKPLMWDEVENAARPFDEMPSMNAALEGAFQVEGVTAIPAYQAIKDSIKNYTPEWAEDISTVPADTIRTLARDFVSHAKIGSTIEIDGYTFPFRPVGIQTERGSWQHPINGPWADAIAKILCELVGSMEVPGGVTSNQTPKPAQLQPGPDGVKMPGGESIPKPWAFPPDHVDSRMFYLISHTLPSLMAKAILDPETYYIPYEVEAIMSGGGNPIHANFDRGIFEAAYAKVPFSVALALTLDETATMADIVLPEDSFLERDAFEFSLLLVMQPHKVMTESTRSVAIFGRRDASQITKVYNTRNCIEIFMDLADRMDMLTGEGGMLSNMGFVVQAPLDINRRYTLQELGEILVKSAYGEDKTLASVNDESGPLFKYKTTGKENYNYYYWPDNTTRLPMYFVHLQRVGQLLRERMASEGISTIPGWRDEDMDFWWKAFQALPEWVTTEEFGARGSEYDLWAFNWKTPGFPFYCGDTYGNVWLHETMNTFDPYEYAILVNADTAAKKGIEDGDKIVVESRYGKTQGKVKVTHLMHPDAVGVAASHGARSMLANPIVEEGPYFNALCTIDETKRAIDPISGGIEEAPAVKIYKA
jgi:anaerobic selenocysteine-containing dehydrogenase